VLRAPHSLRPEDYVRMKEFYSPVYLCFCRQVLGRCASGALEAFHGSFGSHLHDALQEGNAYVVVPILHVPRGWIGVFLFSFAWWLPLLSLEIKLSSKEEEGKSVSNSDCHEN
jgi:hypothetical protein